MKRIMVFVQLALAVTVAAKAQYSDYYYHRIGDTIEWKSEIGYYSWWEWKTFYENNLGLNISYTGPYEHGCMGLPQFRCLADSSILLQRFYTPVPLRIMWRWLGISVKAYMMMPYLKLINPIRNIPKANSAALLKSNAPFSPSVQKW